MPLNQLGVAEVQTLGDDLLSYDRVRREGFVRGVLLPVRNALGNAARVGALLEEGPGPYRREQVRWPPTATGVHAHINHTVSA